MNAPGGRCLDAPAPGRSMPCQGGQGGPPFGARAGAIADAQRLETSHFGSSRPIFSILTWGDGSFPGGAAERGRRGEPPKSEGVRDRCLGRRAEPGWGGWRGRSRATTPLRGGGRAGTSSSLSPEGKRSWPGLGAQGGEVRGWAWRGEARRGAREGDPSFPPSLLPCLAPLLLAVCGAACPDPPPSPELGRS